jgi:glutamate-ammonia-ligase adenylyltransferase
VSAADGLARLLAIRGELGGFLAHRPALRERVAAAVPESLASRARELEADAPEAPEGDLEGALDALRLLRREETCLAACLDLGGVVPFEEASEFLSRLAECIARRALGLAQGRPARGALSVLGMGKLAGRELTYHSDLDLIFLYEGGPERVTEASRAGQRLIAYLATQTGAGIAYAVDARLRPSGQQGTLVTGFDPFERYQCEKAETWEHVAVLRSRAIAGDLRRAQEVLDRVHARLLARRERPWAYLAALRQRVVDERSSPSRDVIDFKTGPGGLMDVDFLAGGACLERGAAPFPRYPSVPAMLRAAVRGGRVEQVLEDYRFLRLAEARARLCAGRGVESLQRSDPGLPAVAELVEPGLGPEGLVERIAATRARVRAAWEAVVEADSAAALEGAPAA